MRVCGRVRERWQEGRARAKGCARRARELAQERNREKTIARKLDDASAHALSNSLSKEREFGTFPGYTAFLQMHIDATIESRQRVHFVGDLTTPWGLR
jgi:hypothetical protein